MTIRGSRFAAAPSGELVDEAAVIATVTCDANALVAAATSVELGWSSHLSQRSSSFPPTSIYVRISSLNSQIGYLLKLEGFWQLSDRQLPILTFMSTCFPHMQSKSVVLQLLSLTLLAKQGSAQEGKSSTISLRLSSSARARAEKRVRRRAWNCILVSRRSTDRWDGTV